MRTVRIAINILMLIFVVLSFVRWEGSDGFIFHAVVGTVCYLLFIIHVFINKKWLVTVTKSIKAGKAKAKLKRQYIIDVLLIAVWGASIITGFLAISYYLNDPENISTLGRLHGVTSRIGVVLIIIHIFQHMRQIRSYFKIKKAAQ